MKTVRGGTTLKPGKIGRVNCLRQQLLMPGERMNIDVSGTVKLESLRERDVMRINAHLACFMTPVRWLWPEYTDYVKEGENTAETIPVMQPSDNDWSKYGCGTFNENASSKDLNRIFADNYLRVYNEWYKWPEYPDETDNDINLHGLKAVTLSTAWSRCRQLAAPSNANETEIGSAINVMDLAEQQGKFRSAMKREVLTFGRWMELVKEMWNGDGSREVDQVPIMIDQAEVGVSPRDVPAMDGASLGQWQSLYDFNVNHSVRGVVAPEHCIVSWFLVVRFPPITETVHPLATDELLWQEMVADPEWIGSQEPQAVEAKQIMASNSAVNFGYLPAGWQWRTEHNVIGKEIYDKNSFPFMQQPTSAQEAKDATRIKNAFRSKSLGDYMVDLYFKEESYQPIGGAIESYFSGMVDDAVGVKKTSDEFPKGGKQL
jgi:hypothetical protein